MELPIHPTPEINRYIEAIYLARFVKMLMEVMADGYGEVSLRAVIKNGRVKVVAVTKNTTYDLDSLLDKE